jgi:hypothetical protein
MLRKIPKERKAQEPAHSVFKEAVVVLNLKASKDLNHTRNFVH